MSTALEDGLRSQMECPICVDVFTDPRQLPCSHNLCANCVRISSVGTPQTVTCPLCRIKHDVPPGPGFPLNHLLDQLTRFVQRPARPAASGGAGGAGR